ncbi:hypothetical protein GCM10010435_61910 [Winogradskya consettensis]|uniref:Uncharacterized protein n=1 Tax=Winogradskya consettensis TaxID=113560 RepID=A0A919SR88_9ACTN|nr:hypothetical protein Aco04nite_48640 [Actinoplanes consettensis]
MLQYSPTEGDPAPREHIATRMSRWGLPSRAQDVLVTTGSQQGLTLVTTVLLEPGDTLQCGAHRQARSKRSSSMTLAQAATKSLTNVTLASSLA